MPNKWQNPLGSHLEGLCWSEKWDLHPCQPPFLLESRSWEAPAPQGSPELPVTSCAARRSWGRRSLGADTAGVLLSCLRVSQEAPSLFSPRRGGVTAAFASRRYLCQPPSKAARACGEMKVFDGIRGSEKELKGAGSCGRQGGHPGTTAPLLASSVPLCQLSCRIGAHGQHQHSKGFVRGQAEDICSPLPPCIITLSSLNMPWGFPNCYFSHVLLLHGFTVCWMDSKYISPASTTHGFLMRFLVA